MSAVQNTKEFIPTGPPLCVGSSLWRSHKWYRVVAGLLVMLLLSASTSGCFGWGPPSKEYLQREAWNDEALRHGPMGVDGTLTITQGPIHLKGDIEGPIRDDQVILHVEPIFRDHYVWFTNAMLDDDPETRVTLLVEGERLKLSGGSMSPDISSINIGETVSMEPTHNMTRAPDLPRDPAGWDSPNIIFAEGTPFRAQDSILSDFERAVVIFPDNSTRLIESSSVSLSFGEIWWQAGSYLEPSKPLSFQTDRFEITGNIERGRIILDDGRESSEPQFVTGSGGRFVAEPNKLNGEKVRITQVLTADDILLSAEIEVMASQQRVEITPGETKWVQVSYREASYEGDALLGDLNVTGDGAHMIQIPLQAPPSAVQEIAEASGPAAALVVPILAPFVFLAEALACMIGGCPENHPFPTYIEAGQVDYFFFKVEGAQEIGKYSATIHLGGQNYETVKIPMEIHVVES